MGVGPKSSRPRKPAGADQQIQARASTLLCGSCGADNPAGQRFCGSCGSALAQPAVAAPRTLANGRFELIRLLGEGGKKRVHLARDTHLEREVALALIKTEGLDAAGRTRVLREAQAMGRLGADAHRRD